jgi:hypothetical protein
MSAGQENLGRIWCDWCESMVQMGLATHQTVSMDLKKTHPDEFCQHLSLGSMGGTNVGPTRCFHLNGLMLILCFFEQCLLQE